MSKNRNSSLLLLLSLPSMFPKWGGARNLKQNVYIYRVFAKRTIFSIGLMIARGGLLSCCNSQQFKLDKRSNFALIQNMLAFMKMIYVMASM